ncbi:hypothetical protein P2318_04975 [Myxococcaceae bacterium GXIMD 01537]
MKPSRPLPASSIPPPERQTGQRSALLWAAAPKAPRRFSGTLVLAFVALQFVMQLALLSGSIGSLRVLVRTGAFGTSLALLVLLPGKGPLHPAVRALRWVFAILGVSLLHPTTNSLLAGVAQIALYVAIVAPIFWVPRLTIDGKVLGRLMLVIFLVNAASAVFGVLQVYFPGSFQPVLSSAIAWQEDYARSLQFTLANGQRIYRPMGLTDVPGGAASAGFFVVLLGSGFLLASRRVLAILASMGLMFLGVFCLYLSQVRATTVILAVALVVLAVMLALAGQVQRLVRLGLVLGLCAVGGVSWAVSVGGDGALKKWTSLFEDDAATVYYANRGHFLEYTWNEVLPEVPLGAGLGRWGMIYGYFGEEGDPERGPLYAELQWTGWLYDGGVPLTLAYVAAVLLAMLWAFRILRDPLSRQSQLWLWASVIFAYDVGVLALTFSYPVFIGQTGLEFWVLNAVLFNAYATAHTERRAALAAAKAVPAGVAA